MVWKPEKKKCSLLKSLLLLPIQRNFSKYLKVDKDRGMDTKETFCGINRHLLCPSIVY